MGVAHCSKHGPHGLSTEFLLGITKRANCPECLREEEYYAARKAGKSLPFVGYERTLDWQSLPEIERLEKFLRERYTFHKSKYPYSGDCDSLVILPGAFTEPLTIYVYYVTNAKEQDYLLTIIEDFFLENNYPQRKVKFFEGELWYEEIRETGGSFWQLDAVLVREEVVL
jgi:hypothetical protein